MTLSSTVNLHHAVSFRALCSAHLVTQHLRMKGNKSRVVHRVVGFPTCNAVTKYETKLRDVDGSGSCVRGLRVRFRVRVQGSRFMVHGFGFRVMVSGQGLGFGVQGFGFRIHNLGFRVESLGLQVLSLDFKV